MRAHAPCAETPGADVPRADVPCADVPCARREARGDAATRLPSVSR
ncbi:hypothetical protein Cus16_0885 [Curtobacterium sp. ER1/6]|nr:hypothetical protein Cus16_0885 [Curtobacterium sp. ER1/6]